MELDRLVDVAVQARNPLRPFELLRAAQYDTLVQEIESGLIDVNAYNQHGYPLLITASYETPMLVAVLLNLGANVNQLTRSGMTPSAPENLTLLDTVIPRMTYGSLAGDPMRNERVAKQMFILIKMQGALTQKELRERENRAVAEVTVMKDLPAEFSRNIIDFMQPRKTPTTPPLNYFQQKELEQKAAVGLSALGTPRTSAYSYFRSMLHGGSDSQKKRKQRKQRKSKSKGRSLRRL